MTTDLDVSVADVQAYRFGGRTTPSPIPPRMPRMTDPQIEQYSANVVSKDMRITKLEGQVKLLTIVLFSLVVGIMALGIASQILHTPLRIESKMQHSAR